MKTYSGKLKDGMPVIPYETDTCIVYNDSVRSLGIAIKGVYHNNEWQLYKPQAKKVWGIPERKQLYYTVHFSADDKGYFVYEHVTWGKVSVPVWLSKHHAEQHAKALNYINEFRALSDVPVDGELQWYINYIGCICSSNGSGTKLEYAICGYVAKTYDKCAEDFANFPNIHIANKIDRMGFHGIVEDVL
jgi:hypothetical protein